jgi:DNA-binding XRE family transcriptional regulator
MIESLANQNDGDAKRGVTAVTEGVKGEIEYIDWDDLRAEIAEQVGPERLKAARQELHAWERAYHLAEARRRRHLTQSQVAKAMGLTQGRVSQIEHGQLGDSEVETLARYAAALGGKLRLFVDFGDDLIQIT